MAQQPWINPPWLKAWTVLTPPPPAGVGPVPSGLVPGDLILCSPVAPNARQKIIIAAQSGVYAPPDALFTHIGIYAGNGEAFDSAPGFGVSRRPFEDVTKGCHIRVRRLIGITPTIQWDVCNEAAQLGGNYNYLYAIAHGWVALLQGKLPQHWLNLLAQLVNGNTAGAAGVDDPLYCSQYVQDVYLKAANTSVLYGRNMVPLPAAFSDASNFAEVSIKW